MPNSEDDSKEHLIEIIPETSSKFSLRDLSWYTDEGTAILSGVTFDIPTGSIVGIIGPSGSGKSTLLRFLNRLLEPPSGSVFIEGKDIKKLNVISLRRRVGILFQMPSLFEGTVAYNVNYGPSLRGMQLKESEVEDLLKLADLEPSFAGKSVLGLSVGQAQRVALARVLANNPEVLLLDEPTSALDPISGEIIENTILNLRAKKGLTIVLVSHNIKQIRRIADMVCLLVKGEIVEVLNAKHLSKATHPFAVKFFEES